MAGLTLTNNSFRGKGNPVTINVVSLQTEERKSMTDGAVFFCGEYCGNRGLWNEEMG